MTLLKMIRRYAHAVRQLREASKLMHEARNAYLVAADNYNEAERLTRQSRARYNLMCNSRYGKTVADDNMLTALSRELWPEDNR